MKVINLFAGPGAGKSTTAAGVFHELKIAGANAELVGEFAKDLTWEGRHGALQNQLYVLGKQYQRLDRLRGQVDIVVIDSPLMLSCVYLPRVIKDGASEEWLRFRSLIGATAKAAFNTFDNINFMVRRNKPYNPKGRGQTEDEARVIDREMEEMLRKEQLPYHEVYGDATAPTQVISILQRLQAHRLL